MPPRRLAALFAALAAALLTLACSSASSGPEADALRERADAFGELLVEMRDLPEGEAGDALAGFLEPGPERPSRVAGYLRESRASSGKYRVTGSSVETIQISPDGTEALVVFHVRARGPQGGEVAAQQQTHWLQVDGEWYRSSREAAKRLDG